MAPKKKHKVSAATRARPRRTIERDVLPDSKSLPVGEVCGACLLAIEQGEAQVGFVDSCPHVFHFECVERWSKTENSCPQCKMRFFWLAAYNPHGQRVALSRVERRDQEGEEDGDFEDVQPCEQCKEVGDESTLLLCDGMNGTCNSAYHLACVGLQVVPRGSWFCPDCVDRGFDTDSRGFRGSRGSRGQPMAATRDMENTGVESAAASQQDSLLTAGVEGGAGTPGASIAAGTAGAAPPIELAEVRSGTASVSTNPAPAAHLPNAGSSGSRNGIRPRSAAMPSQLRLNALACVTPPVDVPEFRLGAISSSGSSSTGGGGLFASFVQRRRAQRGNAGSSVDSTAGFIKLNPKYEEDFMGKKSVS